LKNLVVGISPIPSLFQKRMNMRRFALGAIIPIILSAQLLATTRVDMDRDWWFRVDPDQIGEGAGWQKHPPSGADSVSVPHTWNIGRHDGFLGKAWYFKTFDMPVRSPDLHVKLHFGATFYFARVWLNGVELGTHEGGYTAYAFDISRHLRRTNYVAIEIDNRIGAATIPGLAQRGEDHAWYDWWDYGGMVRDVWLTMGGPVQVRRQQIRSQIVGDEAVIEDQMFLENDLDQKQQLSLRITALGPHSETSGNATRSVALAPGVNSVKLSLKVSSPQLWAIDHPNVYRMLVEIVDGRGSVLDEQSDTFGVRKIEILDRHLLINGERVRLTGVARHEESVWEGLAETAGTMRHDYDDMRSLQVTLTRPVHYPQNSFILDYADRHGILLIPEIPVWQFSETQLMDPRVLALAKRQMREMIEESGNHPSIFAWSVCNESDTGTPGGIAYFRAMRDYIRELDPSRFVSYADDHLPKLKRAEDSAASDADFLMMNQYFGSWHGPESELSESLDRIGRMFPDKMMIVSEFGLPGIFAKDPADADRMRVRIINEQLPELARRDWIAGAILWCYQDYKSRRNLRPGREEGYVEHGLVDEYRQRKPSYYVWKELNAPAAMEAHWERTADGPPSSFMVTLKPNGIADLPSYPLHDYRLAWELSDQAGKLLGSGEQQFADLESVQTVTGSVGPQPGAKLLKLHLTLLRPGGAVAAESSVDWDVSAVTQQPAGRVDVPQPPTR
jgi:beta-glucuronidase